MVSSRDSEIIELWLERQASPHTRSCYQRDADRLLASIAAGTVRVPLPYLGTAGVDAVMATTSFRKRLRFG